MTVMCPISLTPSLFHSDPEPFNNVEHWCSRCQGSGTCEIYDSDGRYVSTAMCPVCRGKGFVKW